MRARALPIALLTATTAAGCHREAAPTPQAQQAPATPTPPTPGPTVDTSGKGKALPTAAFRTMAGAPATLAGLRGKPVLVNLWATWCAPCVKELPTLDALAKREGGKLAVVPVSEDLEGERVVAPFVKAHGYQALTPDLDPANALLLELKETGLPVTILYGADGRELWRVRGDLAWTGAKAKGLLAQAGV